MRKLIYPATLEAAYEVASNLREDDYREITEGWGMNPTIDIPLLSLEGECCYFIVPNGETAGIAGIINDTVWMLCTPAIHKYPKLFVKEAKKWIDSKTEPYLWNVVDKRNTAHIKLLRFLGFSFHEEQPFGPNDLPFIRFSRTWYSQSSLEQHKQD